MAITAAANWYIRKSGSGSATANGGGYDSSISGAGTNYANQDGPQLSLTDLACAGTGTSVVTSATGGFTAAMIGNAINIATATNWVAGFYFITAYTDTNTVTVDRTPVTAAASAGSCKVGGAWADFTNAANGNATGAKPVPGNTVWIRGSGSDRPATAPGGGTNSTGADYVMSAVVALVNGDGASGYVRFIGVNGRPAIASDAGGFAFSGTHHWLENLHFIARGTGASSAMLTNTQTHIYNCTCDQNGNDLAWINNASIVRECEVWNSGTQPASPTRTTILAGSQDSLVIACYIHDVANIGLRMSASGSAAQYNIIARCHLQAVSLDAVTGVDRRIFFENNTLIAKSGATAAGVVWTTTSANAYSVRDCFVWNNILVGFTTGISCAQAMNERQRGFTDYNMFFNCTTPMNNLAQGPNDVIGTDPGFVNATTTSGHDFGIGPALAGLGYPKTISANGVVRPANASPATLTVTASSVDPGAIQRAEGAAAATTLRSITLTLQSRQGAARASLTGLRWAWFDGTNPGAFAAPVDKGTAESTDNSGIIVIPVNTTLASGASGTLALSTSDGVSLGLYTAVLS